MLILIASLQPVNTLEISRPSLSGSIKEFFDLSAPGTDLLYMAHDRLSLVLKCACPVSHVTPNKYRELITRAKYGTHYETACATERLIELLQGIGNGG